MTFATAARAKMELATPRKCFSSFLGPSDPWLLGLAAQVKSLVALAIAGDG